METDADIEGTLARQLGCMNTAERDTLVGQFVAVLGGEHVVDRRAAAFFLDMNNWNVSSAVCSYYDYGGSGANGGSVASTSDYAHGQPVMHNGYSVAPNYVTRVPSMEFVLDVTVGEGESVPPATVFTKTWRLRNSGSLPWPDGCTLRFLEGTNLCTSGSSIGVPPPALRPPALRPQAECDISAQMRSPAEPALYQSRWQLNTPEGVPFGEPIWCIVQVAEGGLLGITQQMAKANCRSQPQPQPAFGDVHARQYDLLPADGAPWSTVPLSDDVPHLRQVDSTLAIRGSPPPLCHRGPAAVSSRSGSGRPAADYYDPPASPNGSCAQYQSAAAGDAQECIHSPTAGGPPAPPTTPHSCPPAASDDEHMQQ